MAEKQNIRNLSLEEIVQEFETIGEKKFRAKQVFEWIWKNGARTFSDMHNVSTKVIEFYVGE